MWKRLFTKRKKKVCREYWAEVLMAIKLEYPSATVEWSNIDSYMADVLIPEINISIYFNDRAFIAMHTRQFKQGEDFNLSHCARSQPWLTRGINQRVLLNALSRLKESA